MFLNSQKNSLYKAVEDRGFNLRDFRLEESTELRLTQIRTGYYFRVYTGPVQTSNGEEQRLYALYKPTFRNAIVTMSEVKITGLKTWPDLMGHVSLWLDWLKMETTQPDLWAEMEHTPLMFADEESVTDERFTQDEIKLLEERVSEVEKRVITLNLPPEAEAAITATVREVPSKAKRFTKKELADCIVGSLVKEGFKWGLTTEHMAAVWHACQHFFTFLLPG